MQTEPMLEETGLFRTRQGSHAAATPVALADALMNCMLTGRLEVWNHTLHTRRSTDWMPETYEFDDIQAVNTELQAQLVPSSSGTPYFLGCGHITDNNNITDH